jgi:hypothetical protein
MAVFPSIVNALRAYAEDKNKTKMKTNLKYL